MAIALTNSNAFENLTLYRDKNLPSLISTALLGNKIYVHEFPVQSDLITFLLVEREVSVDVHIAFSVSPWAYHHKLV